MIELKGKFADAKIFTDNVEETAMGQIIGMLNSKITEGAKVRIMPDCHAGKGSTIGTTIQHEDWKNAKVSPNIVGVDIGCGITIVKLSNKDVDLKKLDEVVNKVIPSGNTVHETALSNNKLMDWISDGMDNAHVSLEGATRERILKSMATLGGGNHYIELAQDGEGNYWLSVHSGSRGLGVKVANYHQNIADSGIKKRILAQNELIEKMKAEGRHSEIQTELSKIKEHNKNVSKEQQYLEGEELEDYLDDMKFAQQYAFFNRLFMLSRISNDMEFDWNEFYDSVHNYIDIDKGIIRKGATSAKKGEVLVIPLNMRDGTLLCEGLGNPDWNFSAPHGAGRKMSRTQAKESINMDTYKDQMKDIYTTSVVESTLDEAPDAYKSADEIIENIKGTAKILHHLKPVYNFKAK